MFCRNCGQKIPDEARFCRYCGTQTPARAGTVPVIVPEPEIPASDLSGVAPEVPDMGGHNYSSYYYDDGAYSTAAAGAWTAGTAAGYVSDPDVGSYEDIMSEFSGHTGSAYNAAPPETAGGCVEEVPKPAYVPVSGKKAAGKKKSGSKNRTALVVVSCILILGLLIAATALCIDVLIPDPEEEPLVVQEQPSPSPSPEEAPSPSISPEIAAPTPSPSGNTVLMPEPSHGVVMPEISPPQQSAEPSPAATPTPSPISTLTPTSTPAPTPTPTPVHNAASGNTTVVGSRYVDNVAYSAYFRSAPEQDDSNVIKNVLLGTKVDFIEVYNSTYSKVKYDGVYGYIATSYLSSTKPNLTVVGKAYGAGMDWFAYLRTSPEQSTTNIVYGAYVCLDQEVGYIESENGYCKIKVGSYYGYVSEDYLSFTAPDNSIKSTMYVTGVQNAAYLMSYPNKNAAALGYVLLDTSVGYISDSSNGYYKVSYNGTVGYVNSSYLTSVDPNDKEAQAQAAQTTLFEYSRAGGFSYYASVDMDGDGITEMLAGTESNMVDGVDTCSSAVLLAYRNGSVVELGTLNDLGGLTGMCRTKTGDTTTIITQWGGSGKNILTFHTLDSSGKLVKEEWVAETTESGTNYTVTANGSTRVATQSEFESKATAMDQSDVVEFDSF